jgi:hypothetical protein
MLLLINNYIFALDPQPKTINGEPSKFAKFPNKVVEVEFLKCKVTYELHKQFQDGHANFTMGKTYHQ